MENYALNFRLQEGNVTGKYETLAEQYSSVTRTFQRMRSSAEFWSELKPSPLRRSHRDETPPLSTSRKFSTSLWTTSNTPTWSAFCAPGGAPMTEEEQRTVRAFWRELKEKEENRKALSLAERENPVFVTVCECLRMIVRRVCSI
ncbi:MAG: hypothetical protein LBP21_09230 [Synergistaceae bacterium]|jgi:hypothetical protein|nr:hypothetical protein [Synergistaceae bacterium]